MATTYFEDEPTAKDRVRGLIWDVVAPFRVHNETIGARLVSAGFQGDPQADSAQQIIPELKAAVNLLESTPGLTGAETTVRQGSVTRTTKGVQADYSSILANLRLRLSQALMTQAGVGTGISVSIPSYPGLDPCNGYPSYGE